MLKGDYRQKLAALQKRRAVTPARRAISGGGRLRTLFLAPAPGRLRGVRSIPSGSHPLQLAGHSSLTIYVAGVALPPMEPAPHGGIENDIACCLTPTGEETRRQ